MSTIQRMTQSQPTDTNFIDHTVKISCLALLAYWSIIVVQPLLTLIAWSIILVVILYPAFRWLVTALHVNPVVAALLVTAVCMLLLIGPATWLSLSLIASLRSLAQRLDSGALTIPAPFESVKRLPLIGDKAYELWYLASTNLRDVLVQIAPHLRSISSRLLIFASDAGLGMLKFMGAVVIAGFLFIPGPSLVRSARLVFRRLATEHGDEFVDLVGLSIRNLARGVIGVALLQALLAGIGLMVAHVPGAGVISLLVLILGIVQVGSAIVIVPLVIWGFFAMTPTAAILFAAYMVPVSLVDNILRPLIMAHGLKTPMPVVLIGLVGGILVHGLIGLFIGPIILAIAWELVTLWTRQGEVRMEKTVADSARG
ncbi:MAG TPA: AI-2E family transporter [Xanthobacteraceae bacterium]|nr:AI-2E family transporter [Xanthobacteraceae bacterium]